jgi:hypothetical protein
MRYQYWRELENGKAELRHLPHSPSVFAVNNPQNQRFVAKNAPSGAQFTEMASIHRKKAGVRESRTPAGMLGKPAA